MWRLLLCLLFLQPTAFAEPGKEATIVGMPYLGVPDSTIDIEFNGHKCTLYSLGNIEQQKFSIIFTCNGIEQLLWNEEQTDYEIDDPRFELLWAGDIDGDGKLDLRMEVSSKYSCSQIADFSSNLAGEDQLVGRGVFGNIECE